MAIALEPTRAVAVLDGGQSMASIDLDTGRASDPMNVVAAPARIATLIRLDNRTIGLGDDGQRVAAWQVTGERLISTAIPLVAPPQGRVIAASPAPDGRRLAMCIHGQPPRIATYDTLTWSRARADVDVTACGGIAWNTDERITVDEMEIVDLKTGRVASVGDSAVPLAGPGDHRVIEQRLTYPSPLDAVLQGDLYQGPRLVARGLPYETTLHWTSDGIPISVVGLDRDQLTLRPDSEGRPRMFKIALSNPDRFAIDDHRAVLMRDGHVEIVTLDGSIHRAPTATGRAKLVVADRGDVVVAADDLTIWRAGAVLSRHPIDALSLHPGPGWLIVDATTSGRIDQEGSSFELVQWDVRSDRRRTLLATNSMSLAVVDVDGDRVVFGFEHQVTRLVGWGEPQRWLSIAVGYEVRAIAGELVAIARGQELVVLDTRQRRAWRWQTATPGCDVSPRFAGNSLVIGARAPEVVEVAELREGALPVGFAASFHVTSTRVGADLLGIDQTHVYLWSLADARVVAWTPEARGSLVTAGRDATGEQLAFGWSTGAIGWALVDSIRARATAAPTPTRRSPRCLTSPPELRNFNELATVILPE